MAGDSLEDVDRAGDDEGHGDQRHQRLQGHRHLRPAGQRQRVRGAEGGRVREGEVQVVDERRLPVRRDGSPDTVMFANRKSGYWASSPGRAPPARPGRIPSTTARRRSRWSARSRRPSPAGGPRRARSLPCTMSTDQRGRRPSVGHAQQGGEGESAAAGMPGLAVDPARVGHHDRDEQQSLHGRQHPGRMDKLRRSGTGSCNAMAAAVATVTCQRASPSVGRRQPGSRGPRAAPSRRGRAPLARRVRGLRLKPLGDQPVQFVDPLVQRTDPVMTSGGRVFLAHAGHANAGYRRWRRPPGRGPAPSLPRTAGPVESGAIPAGRRAVQQRRLHPGPASGLGSHDRLRCPTHGSAVSSDRSSATRSVSVRPARLAAATPFPEYPPAQPRPVALS